MKKPLYQLPNYFNTSSKESLNLSDQYCYHFQASKNNGYVAVFYFNKVHYWTPFVFKNKREFKRFYNLPKERLREYFPLFFAYLYLFGKDYSEYVKYGLEKEKNIYSICTMNCKNEHIRLLFGVNYSDELFESMYNNGTISDCEFSYLYSIVKNPSENLKNIYKLLKL